MIYTILIRIYNFPFSSFVLGLTLSNCEMVAPILVRVHEFLYYSIARLNLDTGEQTKVSAKTIFSPCFLNTGFL